MARGRQVRINERSVEILTKLARERYLDTNAHSLSAILNSLIAEYEQQGYRQTYFYKPGSGNVTGNMVEVNIANQASTDEEVPPEFLL